MADDVDPQNQNMSNDQDGAASGEQTAGLDQLTVYAPRVPKIDPAHETGLFSADLDKIKTEAGSGARGFFDTLSLGLSPTLTAGFNALRGQGSFRDNLDHEQAVDRADAKDHPYAHNIGELLGVLVPLAVAGPGVAVLRGLHLLEAAAEPTELGALAARRALDHVARTTTAAGAAGGAVGQVSSDAISGRLSDPQTYLGSIGGGIVGAVVSPWVGSKGGGAVTGAATPAFQALLHGRAPDQEAIYSGGMAGFNAGTLGTVAENYADSLTPHAKGNLGENLSAFNSYLRGETPVARQVRTPLSDYNGQRGYTVVDLVSHRGGIPFYIESKFGPTARLTPRQNQAINEGLGLRVESWQPQDVGGMASASAAGLLHQSDYGWNKVPSLFLTAPN